MSNKDVGGWLRRKGQRIHTWSRRWFVLHAKCLMMFSKKGDVKCLDSIQLDKQKVVEPPLDPNDPKHGYFDIVNGNDTISLCADTLEEKQTWLRALKRALYADKGGALFSQSLEEILFWEKSSGRKIPYIVDECVQYLYKYGLDVEGIFRLAGRQATIKEVVARFERGEKIEFEKEDTDIHVVAAILKAFLRDLPDSIIPCEFYQKFMNISLRFMEAKDEESKDKGATDLAEALALIPDDNYVILEYVCSFLKKVSEHGDQNKMTMMNIGTIFGNNIIRHIDKENSQLLLCTADLGQHLVFMLLNYISQVFVKVHREDPPVCQSVATADLLHMTDALQVSATQDVNRAKLCDDLQGLDLSSPVSPASSQSSNGSIKVVEDFFSKPQVVTKRVTSDTGDCQLRPPKRTIHLSLKRRPGVHGEHKNIPATLSLLSEPPIPPRRNKLSRNRPVSEKNRPKGVIVSDDGTDSQLSPLSVRESNYFTPPQTPTIPTGEDSHRIPNSEQIGTDDDVMATQEPCKEGGNRNGNDEPHNLSHEELAAENKRLKEHISFLKERYKKDISALRSQHAVLNQKYDHRIKMMESAFQKVKEQLESSLEQEQKNVASAVQVTMDLKKELMQYQLTYGEIPSS